MRPWLRKHAPRLIELVRDEWTWACAGRALTRAGITYRTGRPWDGEHLRTQVARATAPLKGRRAAGSLPAEARRLSQPATPAPAAPMAPQPVSARRLLVQRTDLAQRLADDEYNRLHAKFNFDARVQRRASELRGENIPPWTPEELEEWRIYDEDRRQFPIRSRQTNGTEIRPTCTASHLGRSA